MNRDPCKYRRDLDRANAELTRSIDMQAARLREHRLAFRRAADEQWARDWRIILAVLALLLLAGVVLAGEPSPEPPEQVEPWSEYTATFDGPGKAVFSPGGAFRWSDPCYQPWEGRWSVSGRTIFIACRLEGEKGPYRDLCKVTLEADRMQGRAWSGVMMRMKKTGRKAP